MSTLTLLEQLDRPSILDRPAEPEPFTRGGELTLDEILVSAWEGVAASRAVPCPLCSGTMEPRFGAGPGPVAARCTSCATELD